MKDRVKPMNRGTGSATVDPIKSMAKIGQIKYMLAPTPRDYAIFVCGISWGYRGGDLLKIRWDQVLNDKGGIRHDVRVLESKTKNMRSMPITVNCNRALTALLKAVGGLGKIERDGPVFASVRTGEAISTTRLYQLIQEWTSAAGLKGNYGAHSLRKTFGYQHYKADEGMSLHELQYCFGHATPSTTLRYIGITAEECRQKIRALNL